MTPMLSPSPAPPLAALLELTHRCPLQCPYCSNPLELEQVATELDTQAWMNALTELAELGVLQVHFSGGEPTVRRDLVDLVAYARACGLYSNLITSGVAIDRTRLLALAAAGLDHVQLSFQDAESESAHRISNYRAAQDKKLTFAGWVAEAALPLTVNVIIHRQNADHVEDMIALALDLGAARLEVAHVQYYGWALANRAALLPSRVQLDHVTDQVEAARQRLRGRLVIDYVVPDYYARQPKACMGGWGQKFLNISPSGKVLPCHAAEIIPGLDFEHVGTRSLADIWRDGPAFTRFRGTDWMPAPCQSCDQREIDWGGCRCQALALTGDASATDPICDRAPAHAIVESLTASALNDPPPFLYRKLGSHSS